MALQTPSAAADLRRDRPTVTRDQPTGLPSSRGKSTTRFVEGVVAMLWIVLIVLLVPALILLVGLPIAALLRFLVEAGSWVAALFG
jgi:hypothetical protein